FDPKRMILRADFRAEDAALLSQGKDEKRKDAVKAPLRAGSGNFCYPKESERTPFTCFFAYLSV
ncbi:MAG: hypothetical protein IJS78_07230, partial [Clostridia bacterium]|nr:hypothetical protein [Clostridia bacterium]